MKTRTIERDVWVSDSFINSGIDIEKELDIKIFDFKRTRTNKYRNKAKIIIEVEEEPLTFERIKKECVPMKTILYDNFKNELKYLGYGEGATIYVPSLIESGLVISFGENTYKNWSIKINDCKDH